MASIPTPEESAREILAIFNHFSSRPDEVLQYRSFNSLWLKRGLKNEDLIPGMTFAAQQGWVEVLRNGESLKLTTLGFSEA